MSLPIGPGGQSPILHSLVSEHRIATKEVFGPSDWVYFLGYVEYRSTHGDGRFVSGFCYLLRPEEPNLGLHVAFTDNPGDYWYHRKLE